MHSADYGIAKISVSGRPSVRPSHASILSKRLNISSNYFSPSGSPTILVFPHQTGWQYPDEYTRWRGRRMQGLFSTNSSLCFGNDTIERELLWKANRKPYPSFRMVQVLMTEWLLTQFSGSRHYLTLNISETVRDTDIVSTKYWQGLTPFSRMSFPMTLNDLVKYSMTRNIARFLCDSWASCYSGVVHADT